METFLTVAVLAVVGIWIYSKIQEDDSDGKKPKNQPTVPDSGKPPKIPSPPPPKRPQVPMVEVNNETKVFTFAPRDRKRDLKLSNTFKIMFNREVALEILDPWCGFRESNRRELAKFIKRLYGYNIKILELRISWKVDGDESHTESEMEQKRDLTRKLAEHGVTLTPALVTKSRKDGHFHDRKIIMESLGEEDPIKVQWSVSSGIDNMVSFYKECEVTRRVFKPKKGR